jgi:hypothetical protein
VVPSRGVGFPLGASPAQHIRRQTVRADVLLIQELRGDQDRVVAYRAGLFGSVLDCAVAAVDIARNAMKDDYRAANLRLGLGPIERQVQRFAGGAMRRGNAEGLAGDLGGARASGHERQTTQRPGDGMWRTLQRAAADFSLPSAGMGTVDV